MIIPGPGGLRLDLSPGTEVLQMKFDNHYYLTVNENQNSKFPIWDNPGRVLLVDKRFKRKTVCKWIKHTPRPKSLKSYDCPKGLKGHLSH